MKKLFLFLFLFFINISFSQNVSWTVMQHGSIKLSTKDQSNWGGRRIDIFGVKAKNFIEEKIVNKEKEFHFAFEFSELLMSEKFIKELKNHFKSIKGVCLTSGGGGSVLDISSEVAIEVYKSMHIFLEDTLDSLQVIIYRNERNELARFSFVVNYGAGYEVINLSDKFKKIDEVWEQYPEKYAFEHGVDHEIFNYLELSDNLIKEVAASTFNEIKEDFFLKVTARFGRDYRSKCHARQY